MKISYSFYTLKDLSDLSYGKKLLEILLSNGLVVDKAGPQEPIREDFNASNLPIMWKGVGLEGKSSTCYFLFKGKKEIKFSGMVIWDINLNPNTKSFNSINLWLDIPTSYSINKLVQLGDDIFEWCEAAYGYISEDSKDLSSKMPGNIHLGLPGLMWVNYFGPTYAKDPDFNLPNDYISVSHGVRVTLSQSPHDERLSDLEFLQGIKDKIGPEWFWHYPRKYNKKSTVF